MIYQRRVAHAFAIKDADCLSFITLQSSNGSSPTCPSLHIDRWNTVHQDAGTNGGKCQICADEGRSQASEGYDTQSTELQSVTEFLLCEVDRSEGKRRTAG